MNESNSVKSLVVKPGRTRGKNNSWSTRDQEHKAKRQVKVVETKKSSVSDRNCDANKTRPCEGSTSTLVSDNCELTPCEGKAQPSENHNTVIESPMEKSGKRPGSPSHTSGKRQKTQVDPDASSSESVPSVSFDQQSLATMFSTIMARMDSFEERLDSKPRPTHEISDSEDEQDAADVDNLSSMFDLGEKTIEDGQIIDSDDADFSALLLKGMEAEKKGQPLGKDAQVIVKAFFDKCPDSSVFKPLREAHVEPENCENLSAKDVNPEVFRCLKEKHKNLDFMVKSIQSNVASSSVANLRMIDAITSMTRSGALEREAGKHLLELCCDATKLSSKSMSDLSQLRKYLMRDLLSPKYRSLCFSKTFGNQLFGEDISKTVKGIDDETKIMKDFKKPPHLKRYDSMIPTSTHPSKNWDSRGRGQFRSQYRGFRRGGNHRGRGVSQKNPTPTKQHPSH